MTKTIIKPGIVRLTGDNGIMDKRTGDIYSEFIGKESHEKYFIDAPENSK